MGLSTALVPHPQNLLLSQHRHISLISGGSWNAKEVSRFLLGSRVGILDSQQPWRLHLDI